MFKYKNTSKGPIRFRAFDGKGIKKVFEVKSGEEVELGSKADFPYLELVTEEDKKLKKKKGE